MSFHALVHPSIKDQHFSKHPKIHASKNIFFLILGHKKYFSQNDIILCFGNLPPILRYSCKTFVYFHNRLLLKPPKNLSLAAFLKIKLQQFYIHICLRNADEYLLQTDEMLTLFQDRFKDTSLRLAPFYDYRAPNHLYQKENIKFDFIYVSDFYPHKNHQLLLSSLKLLAEEHISPRVLFVIGQKTSLAEQFESSVQDSSNHLPMNITIMFDQSRFEIQQHYSDSLCLAWSSSSESFGMPLIEACRSNIYIIGPDLPYLNDLLVIDKNLQFELSKKSLAKALKYFLLNYREGGIQKPILKNKIYRTEEILEALKNDNFSLN